MGQFWCPVDPQLYVVQKSWPHLRISLALGLQRGVNSISLQCIPWPVACSEWGACLTPSKFWVWFWGQMTPEWKLFVNFCPKSAYFTHDSRVMAKFGENWPLRVAKKSSRISYKKTVASGTLLSPPFRPHLIDRAQNFVNIVGPWPVHVYQLGPDRLWSLLISRK